MLNNYCQVIEQTDEEKLKMYMKCKKIDLAKMLIEKERISEQPRYDHNEAITIASNTKYPINYNLTTGADGIEYPYTRNVAYSKIIGYVEK